MSIIIYDFLKDTAMILHITKSVHVIFTRLKKFNPQKLKHIRPQLQSPAVKHISTPIGMGSWYR